MENYQLYNNLGLCYLSCRFRLSTLYNYLLDTYHLIILCNQTEVNAVHASHCICEADVCLYISVFLVITDLLADLLHMIIAAMGLRHLTDF